MKKTDYKHGKFTLASTDILAYEYEDFKEWYKEVNEIEDEDEIPSENSNEFWDWAGNERDMNWENDIDNIKSCKKYDVPVVIMGGFLSAPQYAFFYGSQQRQIVPVKCYSVGDAIDLILRKGNYDDVDVEFDNGSIIFIGHHHDGRDIFTIKALSKKGLAKFETAENHFEDVPSILQHDCKRLEYLYAG